MSTMPVTLSTALLATMPWIHLPKDIGERTETIVNREIHTYCRFTWIPDGSV